MASIQLTAHTYLSFVPSGSTPRESAGQQGASAGDSLLPAGLDNDLTTEFERMTISSAPHAAASLRVRPVLPPVIQSLSSRIDAFATSLRQRQDREEAALGRNPWHPWLRTVLATHLSYVIGSIVCEYDLDYRARLVIQKMISIVNVHPFVLVQPDTICRTAPRPASVRDARRVFSKLLQLETKLRQMAPYVEVLDIFGIPVNEAKDHDLLQVVTRIEFPQIREIRMNAALPGIFQRIGNVFSAISCYGYECASHAPAVVQTMSLHGRTVTLVTRPAPSLPPSSSVSSMPPALSSQDSEEEPLDDREAWRNSIFFTSNPNKERWNLMDTERERELASQLNTDDL